MCRAAAFLQVHRGDGGGAACRDDCQGKPRHFTGAATQGMVVMTWHGTQWHNNSKVQRSAAGYGTSCGVYLMFACGALWISIQILIDFICLIDYFDMLV
jgi:hypothetical protein